MKSSRCCLPFNVQEKGSAGAKSKGGQWERKESGMKEGGIFTKRNNGGLRSRCESFLNGSYQRAGLTLEVLQRGRESWGSGIKTKKIKKNWERWGEWKDVAKRWEEVGESWACQWHNVVSKHNQTLSGSTGSTFTSTSPLLKTWTCRESGCL